MLDYVLNKRNGIKYIIVYSLDRFSRTGISAMSIVKQLLDHEIFLVSITQPADLSTPSGRLLVNIQMLISNHDNELRKDKVITGMVETLKKGKYVHKPPIGYTSAVINGERVIKLTEDAKYIKTAFLLKEQGYKNEDIQKELESQGFKIRSKRLSDLFSILFIAEF